MSDYKDFLIENNDEIVGSFICPVMDKYDLIPYRNTLFIRYEDVKDGSLVNVLSEFYDIAPEKFKKDVLYAKAKS